MAKQIMGYIIATATAGHNTEYYAIDGGYPYLSSFFSSAKIFKTEQEAKDCVDKEFNNNKTAKMSDGSVFPCRMIHSALNLNYANPQGIGQVFIMPLVLEEPVFIKQLFGKIIKAKD